VTLGNFATRFVLKTDASISRLRGSVQSAGRFTVLPIYHPAAAIYDRTKRDVLFADFARLRELLDRTVMRHPGPDAIEPGPEPTQVAPSDVVADPGPPGCVEAAPAQETLF